MKRIANASRLKVMKRFGVVPGLSRVGARDAERRYRPTDQHTARQKNVGAQMGDVTDDLERDARDMIDQYGDAAARIARVRAAIAAEI